MPKFTFLSSEAKATAVMAKAEGLWGPETFKRMTVSGGDEQGKYFFLFPLATLLFLTQPPESP